MSLHRDFMPSAWGNYRPTIWDVGLFTGTLGFFVMLIFLFVRVLPAISIAEMRELVAHTSEEQK
jgi:molybdopterin-containing oxidoreductase family membrane subunit